MVKDGQGWSRMVKDGQGWRGLTRITSDDLEILAYNKLKDVQTVTKG